MGQNDDPINRKEATLLCGNSTTSPDRLYQAPHQSAIDPFSHWIWPKKKAPASIDLQDNRAYGAVVSLPLPLGPRRGIAFLYMTPTSLGSFAESISST